ncbi:MAG TPA: hypothetical protein VGE88_15305 [Lysobacter sp.]
MRHDPAHDTVSTGGIDVPLEDTLKYALAIGGVLVLLLPGARGFSETLGWLPLWLLGMPAAALWALRGFPLLSRTVEETATVSATRRRRSGPQARRRARGVARHVFSRAA